MSTAGTRPAVIAGRPVNQNQINARKQRAVSQKLNLEIQDKR